MKKTAVKKILATFMVLIFLVSIISIIPGSVISETSPSNSDSQPSTRAAPIITKVGSTNVENNQVTIYGNEDDWMNLTVYAVDPENEMLVFSDNSSLFDIKYIGFDGASYRGNISFLPKNEHVGNFSVRIYVREQKPSGALQDTAIIYFSIQNINDPPVLDPIDNIVIYQDEWGKVNITATDDDGIHEPKVDEEVRFENNLTFAIPNIKELENYFFTTSHTPGEPIWKASFQFIPDNSMIGHYRIYFRVKDKKEHMDIEVNLTVLNKNDAPEIPEITVNPKKSIYTTNDKILFKGKCNDIDTKIKDSDEELNYTWTTSKKTSPLGYGDELTVTNLAVGDHTITLTVRDKAGELNLQTVDLTIESLFDLDPAKTFKNYTDEPLDLLLFSSDDGVKFKSEWGIEHDDIDISSLDVVALSYKVVDISLVITMELQGSIKNKTGYNYYIYIVNNSHQEEQMDLSTDNLPEFYKPKDLMIYHSFMYEGGNGFVTQVSFGEKFTIFYDETLKKEVYKFSIEISYLEDIRKMPKNFGVFARVLYSSDTGAGDFIFTYDSIGCGAAEAPAPPSFTQIEEDESALSQPIIQASIILIIVIIIAIIGLYVMKVRKERKELVAPASYDYKMISGFQDTEQYDSLYGGSPGVAPAPVQPGMPPGQMPPGMMPPMPGQPGLPPGQTTAVTPTGLAGAACKKCGKAIVLGMSKCPHCNTPL